MPAPFVASSLDSFDVVTGAAAVNNSGIATVNRGVAITTGGRIRTPIQPARTAGGALVHVRKNILTSGHTWFTLRSSTGVDAIRLRTVSGTQSELQYWNGSVWTAIGAAFNTPSTAYARFRIDFSGYGTASGSISWTADLEATATPVGSGSASGLNLSSVPDIAAIDGDFTAAGGGLHILEGCLLQDTTVAAAYAYSHVPTAGGDATGATGTFSNLDDGSGETPDTNLVSLAASGDRYSAKNSANRNYSGRTIAALGFNARLSCGATGPTQVKPYIKVGGTRYYHSSSPLTLTTTKTNYSFMWTLDPSTGAAWVTADAESSTIEYGIEVV